MQEENGITGKGRLFVGKDDTWEPVDGWVSITGGKPGEILGTMDMDLTIGGILECKNFIHALWNMAVWGELGRRRRV